MLAQPGKLIGGDGVGTTGAGLARSQVAGIIPTTRFAPPPTAAQTQGGNLQSLNSSYLATLADIGIVGLLLLLFIALRVVVLAARRAAVGSSAAWTALGVAGLLFLDSTTRTSLTAFPFGYVGLYVLGSALAAAEIQGDSGESTICRAGAGGGVGELTSSQTTDSTTRSPRLVVGSAAAVGSRLVGRVLGLGFVVLLARRESPLLFAEYNYLLVLATAVSVITNSGVAAVAAREVARGEAGVAAAYRAAAFIQSATGVIAALAVIGLGLAAPGPDRDLVALLLLGAFTAATSIFNLQAELLRGAGRPLVEGGVQLLAGILQLGIGAAVLFAGGGLAAVFAALAAKQVAVVIICQILLPAPWSVARDPRLTQSVFRRGLWLGGATTLATVIWRFGALVIGNVGSVAALADFAVSSRYLEVSAMISQTLGIGMLPALARRSAASPQGIRRFTVRIAAILTAITCVLTVPAVLFAGPITTSVFGARYQSAVLPSQVLVGVTPLVVLYYVLWYALVAERLERWVTAAAGTGALAALVSIAWVVAQPTATVTAVATSIAIAVATAVLCLSVTRKAHPPDTSLALTGSPLP